MFRRKKEKFKHVMYEADEGYDTFSNHTQYQETGYNQPQFHNHNQSQSHNPTPITRQSLHNSYNDMQQTDPAEEVSQSSSESKLKIATSTKVILTVGVYILFLLIGIFSTTYGTENDGKKHAQIISVGLRQEREEYGKLKDHYKVLYEITSQISKIDNDFKQNGKQDSYAYTLQYEALIPIVNSDLTAAKNLSIKRHGSLKELLIAVYEDSLNYLSKRSAALARKDKKLFTESQEIGDSLQTDFLQLTEDMRSVSNMVQIDDSELYDTVGGND